MRGRHLGTSAGLRRLIDANAPYWTGEAEVFRRYWRSEIRCPETDRLWLLRQAYKEYWDGFAAPLRRLGAEFETIDRGLDRQSALALAETIHEELAHYVAFAEAYEALLENGRPRLDPEQLRLHGNWPENAALCALRAEHKRLHGEIGERAHRFTEGGYCTLYAEGMRLRGGGGVDDLIAEACARVLEDEFDHMLQGVADLDDANFDADDWELLRSLTVEQMKLRIHMRNAQFSHPLGPGRVAELCRGTADPLPFDYERAGLSLRSAV